MIPLHPGARPIRMSSSKSTDKSSVCPSSVSGVDHIRNPRLFKGMGFTLEERQALGIHGLLPPRIKSLDEQVGDETLSTEIIRYCDTMT